MSITVNINSINQIPLHRLSTIFSKISSSVIEHLHKSNMRNSTFNYTINTLNKGYLKIKNDDPLLDSHCIICSEDYIQGEYKRVLECNHVYHKKCIDKWLKKNYSCPVCRSNYI